MNSFIGWIGGKRALRNEILQRMPADIGRYIEVFGGVIRCLRKVWTATKKSLFATMNYNGKRYILPK